MSSIKADLKDERRRDFYIIDNSIIDEYGSIIGVYGIAIYSLIARYADGNGNGAFPSYNTISEKLGISRPKVIETIKHLISIGLITKTTRTDDAGDATSNLYTISNVGGKPHLPPSKQDLPQVVNDVYQGGKCGLPDQDTVNKTELNKTTTSGGVADENNEVNNEEWEKVVEAYESNIGIFTAMSSEMVRSAFDDYGAVLVVDAIKAAVSQNVRKWAYVDAILKRWKANGRNNGKAEATKVEKTPRTITIFNQYTNQYEVKVIQ